MVAYEALNTVAYNRLRQMIFNGDLEFNTLYSETKLAADLSISRTPVRDALARLSLEHYIDVIPNKGFILHKPTSSDLYSARHFRLAIEEYCASIIAENLQDERNLDIILKMEDIHRLQCAVADEMHLKRFWTLDTEFHSTLVSWLQNPYFDALYANCNYLFTSLPVVSFFSEKRHLTTLEDHKRIIDAMKSGCPESARHAIAVHINESTRIITLDNEAEQ